MKTDKQLLIIPDYMIVLKAISVKDGMSMTDIHYKTQITYSHLHSIKKVLVTKKWVLLAKDGLKHILVLTEHGKELVKVIESLIDKLGYEKDDLQQFRKNTKHNKKKKPKVVHTTEEFVEAVKEAEPNQKEPIIFDEANQIATAIEDDKEEANLIQNGVLPASYKESYKEAFSKKEEDEEDKENVNY